MCVLCVYSCINLGLVYLLYVCSVCVQLYQPGCMCVLCVYRLVVFYEETIPPLQEQWKAIRHSLDPDR